MDIHTILSGRYATTPVTANEIPLGENTVPPKYSYKYEIF